MLNIELYQKGKGGGYYFRMLYGGKVLTIPGCTTGGKDLITLGKASSMSGLNDLSSACVLRFAKSTPDLYSFFASRPPYSSTTLVSTTSTLLSVVGRLVVFVPSSSTTSA